MKRAAGWAFLLVAFLCVCGHAGNRSALQVLGTIRKARLDPTKLYRVREAAIYREDLRIYLTEGTLAFLQPVEGRVTGAVFVGEGELLLIPPDPVEKGSLARFTGVPLLNEKFSCALFRFTDDTHERLLESIAHQDSAEPLEDLRFAETWNPVVANLNVSYEMRVLTDLLADEPVPFFAGRFSSDRLGTFDISVDYRASEQLRVEQVKWTEGHRYHDIWCAFRVRSVRDGIRAVPSDPILPLQYRIQTRLLPTRALQGQAEVDIEARASGERVLWFELSRFLKVSSIERITPGSAATEVEFFQNTLVEEHSVRRRGNDELTVMLPSPTAAGKRFTLKFHYEGEVISDAGNGVLYVGERGSWYPNRGFHPALFDLTFYYPRHLTLVATGECEERRQEGEWRVSRWKSPTRLRVAGFNVGEYLKREVQAADTRIEVYANKNLEPALERRRRRVSSSLPDPLLHLRRWHYPRRSRGSFHPALPLLLPAPPAARDNARIAERIARDAGRNVEFFSQIFGPLPLQQVAISPIPGSFGQGWPGLIYLSTMAFYLPFEPMDRPVSKVTQIFYRTLMRSHELAHQWWGNVVAPATYRDEWLVESLSNYAGLLFLETHKDGDREVQLTLDRLREELLEKVGGEPAERAGPPVLGYRLNSSRSPNGASQVMYNKGTWIIHMLRQLMRDPKTGSDAAFFQFLRAVRDTFDDRPLTTAGFQQLAETFVIPAANLDGESSLDWFFDQWVYKTGIPEVHLKSSTQRRGGKIRVVGKVILKGVDKKFALPVPVYAQTLRGQKLLGVVSAVGEETPFSFPVTVQPMHILADLQRTLLVVVR